MSLHRRTLLASCNVTTVIVIAWQTSAVLVPVNSSNITASYLPSNHISRTSHLPSNHISRTSHLPSNHISRVSHPRSPTASASLVSICSMVGALVMSHRFNSLLCFPYVSWQDLRTKNRLALLYHFYESFYHTFKLCVVIHVRWFLFCRRSDVAWVPRMIVRSVTDQFGSDNSFNGPMIFNRDLFCHSMHTQKPDLISLIEYV